MLTLATVILPIAYTFQTLVGWQHGLFDFIWWTQPELGGSGDEFVASSRAVKLGAPVDLCGDCGGNNQACAGCDGVAHSGLVFDACGVCGGSDDCLDCAGMVNGTHQMDDCGSCLEPVYTCSGGPHSGVACQDDQDCTQSVCSTLWPGPAPYVPEKRWNVCVDCSGVANGTSVRDSCGVCNGHDLSCYSGYSVDLLSREHELCLGQPLRITWQVHVLKTQLFSSICYGNVLHG